MHSSEYVFCNFACSKKLKSGTAIIVGKGEHADLSPPDKGDQWLGHLGNHRNGRTSDVNWEQNWLDREPGILWRKELGKGAAGVAVAHGRVFAIGNTEGSDTIYCLRIDDGVEEWSFSYGCPLGKRMFEGGPTATPTIDPLNRRVYVLSHQGELRCLDMSSGVELWMRDYVRDLGGIMPQYGFAAAPLLVDNFHEFLHFNLFSGHPIGGFGCCFDHKKIFGRDSFQALLFVLAEIFRDA